MLLALCVSAYLSMPAHGSENAVTPSPAEVPSSPVPPAAPSPSITPTPAPTPAPSPVPTKEPYEGELIAQYALQFDGGKYTYAGSDPSTGFDCSGLVFYVYRQFGYRLHRVAADQATDGASVNTLEELLPGDVVCFSWHTNNDINHAGIYIGDGLFIHAMDTAHGILITSLEEYLQTHKWKARRIVGCVQKLTLEEIEAMEQQEWAIQWAIAEEERLEKERLEKEAAAKTTPPPATIPDPDAGRREEEERRRQEEITQAWEEILQEEPVPEEPVPEEPVPEEIPVIEAPPETEYEPMPEIIPEIWEEIPAEEPEG